MKPFRVSLLVALLAAFLCCWWSAVSWRQARDYTVTSFSVPHLVATTSPSCEQIVGILADPNFRMKIHALEQRTGVETLAEPEVVTRRSSWAVNGSYYDQTFTFMVTNK